MPIINVQNVSLTFNVQQNKKVSLKEYLVKGMFRPSVNPAMTIHALSDVSFTGREGERIGVIGHNGAGKSTLLKLLAGIYPASEGNVEVKGSICSLFDISLGFEPQATGWENIVFRSYLQGETPASVHSKLDDIGAFTELGDFLNMPVRNYSAGMMMRLAFSIATAAEPEILLIDEVLAVGDMAFQIKAKKRMQELMASSRLMVIVAHDLVTLRETCTRVIWMKHGKIEMDGPCDEVIRQYKQAVNRAAA